MKSFSLGLFLLSVSVFWFVAETLYFGDMNGAAGADEFFADMFGMLLAVAGLMLIEKELK